MDRRLIEEKIESLRRCVRRVEDKCPADASMLAADWDLQDIVALNLTRAVQLCVDIGAHIVAHSEERPPDTQGATFDALARLGVIDPSLAARMRRAAGFRNIAVHSYRAIDWAIVHAICRHNLDDFKAFARAAWGVLERKADPPA
jgi:uncharacterized protein YutE (UPF0331/DUF86 family)